MLTHFRRARREWDLNPRDGKNRPPVFETGALDRSAIPPIDVWMVGSIENGEIKNIYHKNSI